MGCGEGGRLPAAGLSEEKEIFLDFEFRAEKPTTTDRPFRSEAELINGFITNYKICSGDENATLYHDFSSLLKQGDVLPMMNHS